MPLYEYKCDECGDVFEIIQKFSDAPLESHGNGCAGRVERLVSAPSLRFKGSGWYINDYPKSGKHNGEGKVAGKNGESGSSSKETSETSSSKETKTDTPAPPKTEPAAKPAPVK
jgi:putative FmdB family regulatory protein